MKNNKKKDTKVKVKIVEDELQPEIEEVDMAEEIDTLDDNEVNDSDLPPEKDELTLLNEKYSALEDKYIRAVAEFENFKKRANQELKDRVKYSCQGLAKNIIPSLDNLERAIHQSKDSNNEELQEFINGVEMVEKQIYETFEKNDILRTNPLGDVFDPNLHEAVGVVETDDVEPDHIVSVFQAGFKLHDRVIRPAMVQVAKKKS